jgi:hypothetical protein
MGEQLNLWELAKPAIGRMALASVCRVALRSSPAMPAPTAQVASHKEYSPTLCITSARTGVATIQRASALASFEGNHAFS